MLRVLGDPQVLLVTLSYLVMNYVFYLVTFWSFLYLVQERKLSILESGWLAALPFVVAGIASAAGGRIADRLRQLYGDRRGPRSCRSSRLPLAGGLSVCDRVSRECLLGDCGALPRLRLCRSERGNYWGVAMRLEPKRLDGGDGRAQHGGNLGGVIGTYFIASISASQGGWGIVFAAP